MTVATPRTIEEVADAVRDAAAEGKRVSIVGGGTHAACARPPERVDVELHTSALNGVVSYVPEDMTISVQAGMTAARLSQLLAHHNCRLPLDVDEPERATIGGIVASGWSGPRRFGLGSLRDLLIGARAVLADGTIIKTGGMVVKNVSGYDMTKLLHGSLGSLGVIVEVNFKLLPLPARQITLTFQAADGAAAASAAEALFTSRLPFAAIDAASDGTTMVGCEGRSADVDRLVSEATRRGGSAVTIVEGAAESASAWRARIAPPFGPQTATFRAVAVPSHFAKAAADVERLGATLNVECAWHADAGCGCVDVSVDASRCGPSLARFEDALIERFGTARLLRCPQPLRSALSIFGRPGPGLALMRKLKAQFDPNGVLNAGINAGGI